MAYSPLAHQATVLESLALSMPTQPQHRQVDLLTDIVNRVAVLPADKRGSVLIAVSKKLRNYLAYLASNQAICNTVAMDEVPDLSRALIE